MLLAVRLHDDVDLAWLRPGPGRFVEVVDAEPPAGLARARRSLTASEAGAILELELAEPVVWDDALLDDALEDWLAAP
jgi:hypothetical protein